MSEHLGPSIDAATIMTAASESPNLVRWSANGILQQRFRVIEYRNGFPYTERQEWRDVPTEPSSPPVQER